MFRRRMIELMMLSHPHDCPVCDEGGECHLQDMTVMTGHAYRRYDGLKRTFRNQDLGPFVTHEMNRCITCYRCTRFYNDYAGGHDFGPFGSRNQVYFGRAAVGHAGERVQRQPRGGLPDRRVRPTRRWRGTTRASGTCRRRRPCASTAGWAATCTPGRGTASCGASRAATTST